MHSLIPILTTVLILLCTIASSSAAQSDLFDRLNGTAPFTTNLLPTLSTSDSITEIRDAAQASDGSIYLGGIIEALDTDTNNQTFAPDEAEDRLGDQDMFLLKLNIQGNVEWSRRFGSRGKDELRGVGVDKDGNVYAVGEVGRNMGDQLQGAVVVKYGVAGERVWVRTYGSSVSGDSFTGLTTTEDGTELVVVGTIGGGSTLHEAGKAVGVDSAVVVRMKSENGDLVGSAVGELFESSVGVRGHGIEMGRGNGSGEIFVVGMSEEMSGVTRMYNGIVYRYSYPGLEFFGKVEVRTQTEDEFVGVGVATNGESLYVAGSEYISIYEERDAIVRQIYREGLGVGWNGSIGSKVFADQASIVEGGATEIGKGVGVDEFGNVYVLVEATGQVVDDEGQGVLGNKRPVVVVYGPDGNELKRAQGAMTMSTGGVKMMIGKGSVIIVGWELDEGRLLNQVWMSGMDTGDVYMENGSEYVNVETGDGTNGGGEGGGEGTSGDRENLVETGRGGVKVKLIAVAAGGAAVATLIGIVAAIVIARRRANGGGGRVQV